VSPKKGQTRRYSKNENKLKPASASEEMIDGAKTLHAPYMLEREPTFRHFACYADITFNAFFSNQKKRGHSEDAHYQACGP
jgi:hypothetical protein